jgi:hypothetical protein
MATGKNYFIQESHSDLETRLESAMESFRDDPNVTVEEALGCTIIHVTPEEDS